MTSNPLAGVVALVVVWLVEGKEEPKSNRNFGTLAECKKRCSGTCETVAAGKKWYCPLLHWELIIICCAAAVFLICLGIAIIFYTRRCYRKRRGISSSKTDAGSAHHVVAEPRSISIQLPSPETTGRRFTTESAPTPSSPSRLTRPSDTTRDSSGPKKKSYWKPRRRTDDGTQTSADQDTQGGSVKPKHGSAESWPLSS